MKGNNSSGIVTKEAKEKDRTKKIILLILFIIIIIFLFSYISFALFNRRESTNVIDTGVVVFSYNEAVNGIDIVNAMPKADEEGKKMLGDGEYFDFTVSFRFEQKNVSNQTLKYEVSFSPVLGNTINEEYIKVYLEKNNSSILNYVPKFSELKDSTIRAGSKLMYKTEVLTDIADKYRLRIWLDESYPIDNVVRTFKLLVNVDGYFE